MSTLSKSGIKSLILAGKAIKWQYLHLIEYPDPQHLNFESLKCF